MKIEVKHLLSQPEGSSETYPSKLANLPIDEITPAQFTGEATLTKLNDSILVQIIGQAQLIQLCSRCLKEVALNLPLNFTREFRINPPTDGLEDTEISLIEDGKIDLVPPLTEEIAASIPIKVLCQENCKGLCPKCGINLNDNPCQCDKVNYEVKNKIKL